MRPNETYIQGLKDLINYFSDNTILCEIGCYAGESTAIFLNSGKIATLYAIDPWMNGYDNNDLASSSNMKLVEELFDETIHNTCIIISFLLFARFVFLFLLLQIYIHQTEIT